MGTFFKQVMDGINRRLIQPEDRPSNKTTTSVSPSKKWKAYSVTKTTSTTYFKFKRRDPATRWS